MDAGTIELPLHLWWSRRRVFDMGDPVDRCRIDELVLREGTTEDVRHHISRAGLRECLPDLVLPDHIRELWQHILDQA